MEASRAGFEVLAKEINTTYDKKLELDEIVYGYVETRFIDACCAMLITNSSSFIKVANETMCRPIRALTEARGYALHKHM